MAQIIQAPNNEKIKYKSVFLAGGITNCNNWQLEVSNYLKVLNNITIINPRNNNFNILDNLNQIKWEFNQLEKMDIFSMYFCNSVSNQPICLYELGRNILKMQIRFPNDWWERIVISIENGYQRELDVVEQLKLCAPKLRVFTNTTPRSHSMRIAEAFAKI